jgi:hypothetical protein
VLSNLVEKVKSLHDKLFREKNLSPNTIKAIQDLDGNFKNLVTFMGNLVKNTEL